MALFFALHDYFSVDLFSLSSSPMSPVQPQTVSGWSSYRQTKTQTVSFFVARFRAIRVDIVFLKFRQFSLVRSYVFCSWLFATGSIIYIELS
jgi:hypothetical protein